MKYEERVPTELIKEGHYLGRPADFDDKIIKRRVNLVKAIPGFCDKDFELLDIGCGNGASIFLLSPEMRSCLGVEIESTHLAEFEKHKEIHQIENCSCIVHDIETEPLTKQFDRVISFEVIEHLKDDKNVVKFLDCLKPGGLIAITVPNKWWIFETHGAKLPFLPWNRVPFFSWLPRPIHERFANARIYTKNRICNLMTNAGFEVIEMFYITAPLDVLKDSKLKRWLTRYIFKNDTTPVPIFSTSILLVARKP